MTDGPISDGIVIAAATAERLRRRRLVAAWLRRVVPIVAGALLPIAVVVRWRHLPPAMFWAAFAASAVGVFIIAAVKSRVGDVTDADAARIDADAALDGELRSAHWFVAQSDTDAWTALHLERAAARVAAISWPAVYPPLGSARVWAGSAALALAAVAIVLSAAWPAAMGRTGTGGVGGPGGAGDIDGVLATKRLSGDLQKQIDDLIKAVQNGTMPLDVARAKISEMRDAVADLDPKAQRALADAMKGEQPSDWNADDPDPEIDALAKKAEKAAAGGELPQDVKWSLQDLAAKLAKASRPNAEPGDQTRAAKPDAGARGGDQPASPGDKMENAGLQMTRSAAADGESSQMMATTGSPMGGERGANGENQKKGMVSAPIDLAGALRKETVQADADSQGSNVLAEMRRKSEQSHSTLAFTRVKPLAAYDKSHAMPPPPAPDALRPLLKQYFIRR